MCGIAGIALTPKRALPDLRERLMAMRESMVHRGPDDAGLHVTLDDRVGLANRRLAIRDLSPAGHMPMSNEEGTVWITYNGEIYNTDELRSELESLGYKFVSQSDTEVVLHGYEAWGEEVVYRLRGMFAFAILTVESSTLNVQRLFLARDRLGIKPLYYAQENGILLFASELKALRASGLISRTISPAGLVGYLLLGSVPNPWTIYDGLWALPPASTLVWENGHIEIQRYWELPTSTTEPPSYISAVEQVRALLQEAVRVRLVSDVPLGAFLSGGLDSSAVVALMREVTNGSIRTCSMVFEEEEYSEAPYARAVAEATGTEHFERVITAQDIVAELEHIFCAMDQPTVDGVNIYFVSKTAQEAGLTVALSGLGGDELFGGYPNTFQGVPQMVRALSFAQAVPGGAFLAQKALHILPHGRRWIKVYDALERPVSPASAYLTRRGLFSPREVRGLVSSEVWHAATQAFDPIGYVAQRADGPASDGRLSLTPASSFDWVSRAELRTYTHNQLLRDTDVMSMAHSLEVRVPLLDHRLVETVLRLPPGVRENGQQAKALLLTATRHLLPPLVRERNTKQGFTFPFERWMRTVLRGHVESSLDSLAGETTLTSSIVGQVWEAYLSDKSHWSRPWALATLARWARNNQLVL